MERPIVFAEMCAGLASLSRMLQGGRSARPPVSRMGNKFGYAETILALLGLEPGQGAESYLWCEPDDGCRALLMAYCQPDVLKEAAEHLRSWADEEPRELWERLRAEGPIKGAEGREVARWALLGAWTIGGKDPLSRGAGYASTAAEGATIRSADGRVDWMRPQTPEKIASRIEGAQNDAPTAIATDAREIARWLRIVTANRLINLDPKTWTNTGQGGSTFGGSEFCTDIEALEEATRAAGMEWPPVQVVDDGRVLDAREVARWCLLGQMSFRKGEPDSGMVDRMAEYERGVRGRPLHPAQTVYRAWPDHHNAPTVVANDGRIPAPPLDLSGVVQFWDPPYSPVSEIVPPMLAAERLPLGRVGRAEGDAALLAVGLKCLREPVAHLRVAVLEVLRTAGVEAEVLDSVVERVVVDVVDDLVWTQWAADGLLHHKAVFSNHAAVVTAHPVPVARPALALVHATRGGELLPLRGHLRDFALRCEALPSAAAKFSKALTWAGCALSAGLGVPCTGENISANLAGDLERHCALRVRARQDINSDIARPGAKTTGYAHDLPRSEWVPIAREWAAAGAWVLVSEAEPIPELMAEGWHAVEITACRVGQRRTFSKQQREWVTSSRPFDPDGLARVRLMAERAERQQQQAEIDAATEQVSLF